MLLNLRFHHYLSEEMLQFPKKTSVFSYHFLPRMLRPFFFLEKGICNEKASITLLLYCTTCFLKESALLCITFLFSILECSSRPYLLSLHSLDKNLVRKLCRLFHNGYFFSQFLCCIFILILYCHGPYQSKTGNFLMPYFVQFSCLYENMCSIKVHIHFLEGFVS